MMKFRTVSEELLVTVMTSSLSFNKGKLKWYEHITRLDGQGLSCKAEGDRKMGRQHPEIDQIFHQPYLWETEGHESWREIVRSSAVPLQPLTGYRT